MSFLDDKDYDIDEEFSQERLQEITPQDLMAFLNFITFGEEEPGEGRFLEARVMSGELEVQRDPLLSNTTRRQFRGSFPTGVGAKRLRASLLRQYFVLLLKELLESSLIASTDG